MWNLRCYNVVGGAKLLHGVVFWNGWMETLLEITAKAVTISFFKRFLKSPLPSYQNHLKVSNRPCQVFSLFLMGDVH